MVEPGLTTQDIEILRLLVAQQLNQTIDADHRRVLQRILTTLTRMVPPRMPSDDPRHSVAFSIKEDDEDSESSSESEGDSPTKSTGPRIDNE